MRPLIPLGLFCLVFAVPDSPKILQEFAAKVISVTNGDTLTVLVDRQKVNVRLEGIDAPEKNQAFGRQAKSALSKLVMRKPITLRVTGENRNGQILARIDIAGVDVSAEMIRLGMAWHNEKYSDDEDLARLQALARGEEVGLWAEGEPLPPWEYRVREKLPEDLGEAVSSGSQPHSSSSTQTRSASTGTHWLNTSGNVRHNSSCQYFQNTKRGRLCGPTDGKACGKCGG